MEHIAMSTQEPSRVFRLAYASRATGATPPASVSAMVQEAAHNNRRNQISGVLFSGNGIYLQWLEGAAPDVCSLMSRIADDPRHSDVTILSAGWMDVRRFPCWPMELSNQKLTDEPLLHVRGKAPCDLDRAMNAFDRAAQSYRNEAPDVGVHLQTAYAFTDRLWTCCPDTLPALPKPAQSHLRARVALMDAVFERMSQYWKADRYSSAEIMLALTHLNRIWQNAGRVPDPLSTRHVTAIVVPPDNQEILSAIIKADLLRSSGVSVQMVMEPDLETTFATLAKSGATSILVTGGRIGLSGDQDRADYLAQSLRIRFPKHIVHCGGRAAGPICDCPERIGFGRDKTAALPARNVEWLALQSMARLSSGRV